MKSIQIVSALALFGSIGFFAATTEAASPPAPSGLSATMVAKRQVKLRVSAATGLKVRFERASLGGSKFSKVSEVAATAGNVEIYEATDKKATTGKTYCYRARAISSSGNSTYTEKVCLKSELVTSVPQPGVPQPPVVACNPVVSAATTSIGYSGGSGSFRVDVAASCAYSVISESSHIIISGSRSRTGSQQVAFSVAANSQGQTRSGTITAAGRTITIVQDAAPAVDRPPVVALSVPTTAVQGAVVKLSAFGSSDPDGSISSYQWDFGDGSTAEGVLQNHIYVSAGTYLVRLTVVDNAGLSASKSASISISADSQICSNGRLDAGETSIDCGGACGPCGVGLADPSVLPPKCRAVPDRFHGMDANRISIVIVPSGFNGDMTLFEQKVQWITSIFDRYTLLNRRVEQLNVLYSLEEQGSYCIPNWNGTRLVWCGGVQPFLSAAACPATGQNQQILVIHNSAEYGGAGGMIATTSVHPYSPQVAIHELGHSMFGLQDEYAEGMSAGTEDRNCAFGGCSNWSDMLGLFGVGCVGGRCSGAGFSVGKPSIMEALSLDFGEVNERFACCAYKARTGEYPSFCSKFQNRPELKDLTQYCTDRRYLQTQTTDPIGNIFGDWLGAPVESNQVQVTMVREGSGWKVLSKRPVLKGMGSGKLRLYEGVADPKSQGRFLEVADSRGKLRKRIQIDEYEDVEVPGEPGSRKMAGRVKMKRDGLQMTINAEDL